MKKIMLTVVLPLLLIALILLGFTAAMGKLLAPISDYFENAGHAVVADTIPADTTSEDTTPADTTVGTDAENDEDINVNVNVNVNLTTVCVHGIEANTCKHCCGGNTQQPQQQPQQQQPSTQQPQQQQPQQQQPQQQPESCKHGKTSVTACNNGTHKTTCDKCKVTVSTANCTYSNGKCTVCGYVCKHGKTSVTACNNGTHKTTCDKCKVTVSTANCTYSNGKCTVCGYNCKHTYGEMIAGAKKTHGWNCTICGYTKTENCTFDVVFGTCKCGNTEGNTVYSSQTIYVNPAQDYVCPDPIVPDDYVCPDPIVPDGGSNTMIIQPDDVCPDVILPDNAGDNVIQPDNYNYSDPGVIAPDPTN